MNRFERMMKWLAARGFHATFSADTYKSSCIYCSLGKAAIYAPGRRPTAEQALSAAVSYATANGQLDPPSEFIEPGYIERWKTRDVVEKVDAPPAAG